MEARKKHEIATQDSEMDIIVKQAQVSMFLNEQRFEFAQRIGNMISASTMVPDHFRNNIGNCMIALNLAERLGVDVFGLMSTSYVVHGKPGFESKLLIAIFNSRTKLFVPPIRWEFRGDFPQGKDAGCRAYAVDKETKEPLYGEWIDRDLVKAEGWDSRNGSKWLTIPGQMFRYRAASFFINVYEPGLKLGIQTVDELEDVMIDVTPTKKHTKPKEFKSDQTLEFDAAYPQEEHQFFVAKLAEHYGKTEEQIKTDAMKDQAGYEKGFLESHGDINLAGKGPKENNSFRSEFINLKGAGYSTWVFKSIERLKEEQEINPEVYEEARKKWNGFYDEPWPINDESPEEAATVDQPLTAWDFTNAVKPYADELSRKEFAIALEPYSDSADIPKDKRGIYLTRLKSALDSKMA